MLFYIMCNVSINRICVYIIKIFNDVKLFLQFFLINILIQFAISCYFI